MMNCEDIVIKINELENDIKEIYKFNKENNETIYKLFELHNDKLINYIETNNNDILMIKGLLVIFSISISIITFVFI